MNTYIRIMMMMMIIIINSEICILITDKSVCFATEVRMGLI